MMTSHIHRKFIFLKDTSGLGNLNLGNLSLGKLNLDFPNLGELRLFKVLGFFASNFDGSEVFGDCSAAIL
jgi:hypothetical protein